MHCRRRRQAIRWTLSSHRFTELLLAGKVDAFSGRYAYGFIDRTEGGVRVVGHGGGAPGMNGELRFEPRAGFVVAVLANLDPPAASRVADFIINRVQSRSAASQTTLTP